MRNRRTTSTVCATSDNVRTLRIALSHRADVASGVNVLYRHLNAAEGGIPVDTNEHPGGSKAKKAWVEPRIEAIDVSRADAFIGRGADAGGNPTIDCQRS